MVSDKSCFENFDTKLIENPSVKGPATFWNINSVILFSKLLFKKRSLNGKYSLKINTRAHLTLENRFLNENLGRIIIINET